MGDPDPVSFEAYAPTAARGPPATLDGADAEAFNEQTELDLCSTRNGGGPLGAALRTIELGVGYLHFCGLHAVRLHFAASAEIHVPSGGAPNSRSYISIVST